MILAGGLGTRLRPYTLFVPKPMLPVGHTPILERIVEWLKANDVDNIVVSTGYLGKMIRAHFGNGRGWGVRMEYAISERPLGIAGQLKNAGPMLSSTFICLYGDAIVDFDLRKLVRFHNEKEALLTMALMKHEVQVNYGVIELEQTGKISAWKEKPLLESDINIGCYVMNKRYLDYIPAGEVAGMKEAFDAAMANREPLYGLKVEGEFWDIGDKKAYMRADEHFQKLYGKVP